jgi:hypothetical protein
MKLSWLCSLAEFKIIVIGHKHKPNSDKMKVFYWLADGCAFHATSLFLLIEGHSVCKPNAFKYLNNGVLIRSPVSSESL